jgi:glycosyltransferase involved in cell wall biosynthesis
MSPRVSVVVPSFNNAEFIEATMESVLAQTFADFELVVADHSSTDGTWDLLQRYADEPRVRLLSTPTGGGAERNWNRVTDEARGDLVKLVCGDDMLYPEMLARQVAAFDSADDNVAMVASPRDIVDASGRLVVRNIGLGGLRGRVSGQVALRRSVLAGANIFGEPCCVMLRRETLQTIGGWHGSPGFMIDQATYLRALLHGDLMATPGPLSAFRLSSTQWSVALAKEQARSAAEMHRQLAEMTPGLLSRSDVRRGDMMAALRAAQRRVIYLYLGRRMRPGVASSRESAFGGFDRE